MPKKPTTPEETKTPEKTHEWLEEALMKRRSLASTVLLLETSDGIRSEQVKKYFLESTRYKDHQLYVYDPWSGLRTCILKNMQLEYEQVQQQDSGFSLGSTNKMRLMQEVLDLMETKLQTTRTIFLIEGVCEKDLILQTALRAWHTNGKIFKNGSCIFLIGSSDILDDNNREQIPIIDIPVSTQKEREDMTRNICKAKKLKNGDKVSKIAQALGGLDLHQCETILVESYYRHNDLVVNEVSNFKSEIVKRSGVLEIMIPNKGFETIGGYSIVKEFIGNNIINILSNPKRAEKFGLKLPRGILLFGPPGTGKTIFGKAMAKEIGIPFINLKTENIFSSLVGSSERKMKKAIEIIEAISPALVFMDEIDRLGSRGGGDLDGGTTKRVFSQMLEWLGDEDRKALIVGTTNGPDHLDPAFLRTGRFGHKIPLLLPDEVARKEILRVHTNIVRNVPVESMKWVDKLKMDTLYFTGAEIEELVIRAARRAFNRDAKKVTETDFEEAVASFRINERERQNMASRYIGLAEKYCDDEEFLTRLTEDTEFDRIEEVGDGKTF